MDCCPWCRGRVSGPDPLSGELSPRRTPEEVGEGSPDLGWDMRTGRGTDGVESGSRRGRSLVRPRGAVGVLSRGSGGDDAPFHSDTLSLRAAFPFPTRRLTPIFLFPSIMGRKLDPTKKEKRGPGRKARKQKGAETELARFLPAGEAQACLRFSSLCAAFPCALRTFIPSPCC